MLPSNHFFFSRFVNLLYRGMCLWIRALEEYDKVVKIVNPKRAKEKKAQAEYKITIEGLRRKQEELREIIERLDTLQHKLDETQRKKKNLDEEVFA
jgi:dynein heavy chain, axonemal